MRISPIGKFLQELRISKHQLLFDMAYNIEMSTTELSRVEQGIRKLQKNEFDKIIQHYRLPVDKAKKFRELYYNQR